MKNKGSFQLEFALIVIFLIGFAYITISDYYPVFTNMGQTATLQHTNQQYPVYTLDKSDGQQFTTIDSSNRIPDPVPADDSVVINAANFPDTKFREFAFSLDSNDDGLLQLSERESVSVIQIQGTEESYAVGDGLTSIKGIEHFPNLVELRVNYNQLKEINVSNNPKLRFLAANYNHLETADFSYNPEIVQIFLSNNELKSINISHNSNLATLYCDNNELETLNAVNNTKLTTLGCSNNSITILDVAGLINIQELYCYDNNITILDVSNLTKLIKINIANNQISVLDVSNAPNMTQIVATNNNLTTLDVSNNPVLSDLKTDPDVEIIR